MVSTEQKKRLGVMWGTVKRVTGWVTKARHYSVRDITVPNFDAACVSSTHRFYKIVKQTAHQNDRRKTVCEK